MIELIVILAFANYIISRVAIVDKIFEGWRSRLLGWIQPTIDWEGKIGLRTILRIKLHEMLTCMYCFPAYPAAAMVFVVDRWYHPIPLPALVWLTTWGITHVIWQFVDGVWVTAERKDDDAGN